MVTDIPQVAVGVREGDILAGKYRVERILGAGGMGVVVAAHHIQLDERVAIKFLRPEASATRRPWPGSRAKLVPPSRSRASTSLG